MVKIIGLGHKKRSGKDTCAEFMLRWAYAHNFDARIVSFASELKKVSHQLFKHVGLKQGEFYEIDKYQHLKEEKLEQIKMSPRDIYLKVGQDMRQIDPDVWINCALNPNNMFGDILIIPDLRFPNEFERIKKEGGFCIKVERHVNSDDFADQALINEKRWDHTILNLGSLGDLEGMVGRIMNELFDSE